MKVKVVSEIKKNNFFDKFILGYYKVLRLPKYRVTFWWNSNALPTILT